MLSPRPHARVVSIDASRALAMPGVHAVLTADDMPPPPPPPAGPPPAAGAVAERRCRGRGPDCRRRSRRERRRPAGTRRQRAADRSGRGRGARARRRRPPPCRPRSRRPATPPIPGELALAKEAMYEGEPILAVAADSEELAAAAIEAISVTFEPLDFAVDPLDSLRPGGPNARTEGNVFVGGEVKTIKWTAEQHAAAVAGRFPTDAEAGATTVWGDVDERLRRSRRRRRAHVVSAVDVAPAARVADGDGLLAERQAVSARLDAERVAHDRVGRRLGRRAAAATSSSSASTPAAASAARFRARRRWRFRRCCRRS